MAEMGPCLARGIPGYQGIRATCKWESDSSTDSVKTPHGTLTPGFTSGLPRGGTYPPPSLAFCRNS
eukprot:2361826-Rhodomonas_salina.1